VKDSQDLEGLGNKLGAKEGALRVNQLSLLVPPPHDLGVPSQQLLGRESVLQANGLLQEAFKFINHGVRSIEVDLTVHRSLVELLVADEIAEA